MPHVHLININSNIMQKGNCQFIFVKSLVDSMEKKTLFLSDFLRDHWKSLSSSPKESEFGDISIFTHWNR